MKLKIKRYVWRLGIALGVAVVLFLIKTPTQSYAVTRTWDGGGSTASWDECANWSGDACPGSVDAVVFDGTSTKSSSVTVGSNFLGTISTFNINSGYTGTVTQTSPLVTTSTFVISTGHYTAANQALTIGGNFTMNAGSDLTLSSGTTTFSGFITINGGSFANNGGTVVLNGNSKTYSCNNVTWNLVQFASSGASTPTVNATCSFPLGNNPTLPQAVVLNGTLSGTGTLSLTFGGGLQMKLNAGSALTGFSGLTNASTASTNFIVQGGTFNASAYTTFDLSSSNSTLTVTSGSISLPTTSSLASLTISGGTFNASSGVMGLTTTLSISGSPTFNANGGTLNLTGSGANAISCGNVTFNLVTFNQGGNGVKTINSDCSLPLGNNPFLSRGIVLNGTLSGTGTLTWGTFTNQLNAGSALSGFSGFASTSGSVTIAGATIDLSGYSTVSMLGSLTVSSGTLTLSNTANAFSTLTVSGGTVTQSTGTFTASSTVTVSTGSLTLANGADLNGALTISGGTFNAPPGNMTLAGALTISGSPTFNANGGSISFDGGAAILSCNNVIFNSVNFTGQTGGKTVNSNCSLPLGANPVIPNSLTLSGTLSGTGTLTESTGTLTLNTGSILSGFTGLVGPNLTTTAVLDFSTYTLFTLSGNLRFNAGGSFIAPPLMTIGGQFNKVSPTQPFDANHGTVVFVGSSNVITSNDVTFYNLSKTDGGTLSFENTPVTATILGTLTLTGHPGALLAIRSRSSGTQSKIDAQGPRLLNYLDVQDSNNINAATMIATNSVDSGNNTNWSFTSSPVNFAATSLSSPGDLSYTNAERPVFSWHAATSNALSSITSYRLSVTNPVLTDGTTAGSFTIADIPARSDQDIDTSRYNIHYANFNDNDPGNDLIFLYTKSSKDWGNDQNDGQVRQGVVTWKVTAFDAVGNSTEPYHTFFVDLTKPEIIASQINNLPFDGKTFTTSVPQPVIFGIIVDHLAGTPGNQDQQLNGPKVASGPQEVVLNIQKQWGPIYYQYEEPTILQLAIPWYTCGSVQIQAIYDQQCDKYLPFSFIPRTGLSNGTYKVTLTGKDIAQNDASHAEFTLIIGKQPQKQKRSFTTPITNSLHLLTPTTTLPSLRPSPSPTTRPYVQPSPKPSASDNSLLNNIENSFHSFLLKLHLSH